MSGKAKADAIVSGTYSVLGAQLLAVIEAAHTSAELWKAARSEFFQSNVKTLDIQEQNDLRDRFKNLNAALKGRIKAEEVEDVPLIIDDWDFNFGTPEAGKEPREFVILQGLRTDTKARFKMLSSGYSILRYFRKLGTRTQKNSPQHITLVKETPDQIEARGGDKSLNPMWLVKVSPVATTRATGDTPF